MRDLRIGAMLALIFAGVFVAFTAFAQQPASGPTPDQAGADEKMSPHTLGTVDERFFSLNDEYAPAELSPANDAKDRRWWLDRGTALTADQKRAIYEAIASRSEVRVPPSPDLFAEPSAVVPKWVNLIELPEELKASIPYIKDFKFVLTGDKVLLVDANDGAVATVVEK